jgi:hypothetical protein
MGWRRARAGAALLLLSAAPLAQAACDLGIPREECVEVDDNAVSIYGGNMHMRHFSGLLRGVQARRDALPALTRVDARRL